MKITHPQAIPVYMTFFFQTNTIGVILTNILALSSFIIAVDCNQQIEAQKRASIHRKEL